ncbi:unnamed protein product [Prunus armeniaca]|uniref:Uncharacterized protein n=1 Tax=Prunus armeniaca TaxID=36596 RepID=A0A6J5VBV9_PRUAR|nr:unnamed protein product [Prunus armeniaca]
MGRAGLFSNGPGGPPSAHEPVGQMMRPNVRGISKTANVKRLGLLGIRRQPKQKKEEGRRKRRTHQRRRTDRRRTQLRRSIAVATQFHLVGVSYAAQDASAEGLRNDLELERSSSGKHIKNLRPSA